MAKGYADIETPKEVQEKALQAIEMARETGRVRKGTNEATKSIEKGDASLVVIAEDVDPPEVVMHLPMICKEKRIPYVFVPGKKELGKSAGLEVSCSAIAIEKAGNAESLVNEIIAKMGGKPKAEREAEEKEERRARKAEERKAEVEAAEKKKEKPGKERKPKARKEEKVEEKPAEKKE